MKTLFAESELTLLTPRQSLTTRAVRSLATTTLVFAALALVGCASTPRTKWTDPTLRVAIDPASIDANNYVRIQQALVESGKYVVVDRAMAFNAIKHEQERQHREDTDRFMDREKFAIWGRLLGVGGVVVAHTQCALKGSFWTESHYQHCSQYISIVSANTAEVIAVAESEENGSTGEESIAPSWNEVVAKLNKAFPANFVAQKLTPELESYKDLAGESALRQREGLATAERNARLQKMEDAYQDALKHAEDAKRAIANVPATGGK